MENTLLNKWVTLLMLLLLEALTILCIMKEPQKVK